MALGISAALVFYNGNSPGVKYSFIAMAPAPNSIGQMRGYVLSNGALTNLDYIQNDGSTSLQNYGSISANAINGVTGTFNNYARVGTGQWSPYAAGSYMTDANAGID